MSDELRLKRALEAALDTLPHFFLSKEGGWGYQGGKQAFIEPTSYAILALLHRAEKHQRLIDSGVNFIKSCQCADGTWGIKPGDGGGTWLVAKAILALYAARQTEAAQKLCQYLLSIKDGYDGRVTAELKNMNKKIFRLDITAHGWPYTPGTASWVEPTAYAILALAVCGYPLMGRQREAIRYLETRKTTTGGWNYGNPYVFDQVFPAFPLPTAAALIALRRAGVSPKSQLLQKGLKTLTDKVPRLVSHRSIALTALCLAEFGSKAHQEALLNQLCLNKAGWLSRRDPVVTSLAALTFIRLMGGDPFGPKQ